MIESLPKLNLDPLKCSNSYLMDTRFVEHQGKVLPGDQLTLQILRLDQTMTMLLVAVEA